MSTFRRRLMIAANTIKSCFGKGFWINEAMWSNSEGWTN